MDESTGRPHEEALTDVNEGVGMGRGIGRAGDWSGGGLVGRGLPLAAMNREPLEGAGDAVGSRGVSLFDALGRTLR